MGETSDAASSRMIQMRTVVETMTTVSPDGNTTVKTTKTIDEFVLKESRHLTANQKCDALPVAKANQALEPLK